MIPPLTAIVSQLVQQYTHHLEPVAQSWLGYGASTFSIWQDGQVVRTWHATQHRNGNGSTSEPILTAPLLVEGVTIAELRVSGLSGDAHAQRLHADSVLISGSLQLEGDLDTMTGELAESQDRLRSLSDFALLMRRGADIPTVLAAQAQTTAELVGAEASFVLLELSDSRKLVTFPEPWLDEDELFDLFHDVQATRLEYFYEQDRPRQRRTFPPHIANLLVLPLLIDDAIVACLGLYNQPDGFPSTVLHLARAIAEQASAQIENVLLHQEMLERAQLHTEMQLAAQAQLNLLPSAPPQVPGLDIFAETRPAFEVGGDFYDFISTADRGFIFALGDIAGKGMSAALLMAMTLIAIRSKASHMPNAAPDSILARSHADMRRDFARARRFASVFVGMYTTETATLAYSSAGHSPVILCPPTGEARVVDTTGPVLGLPLNGGYELETITMTPGTLLVVASDGISEAMNQQREMFGDERLLHVIETARAENAAAIAAAILQAVTLFQGADTRQEDDQTIMVIKAAGTPC